MDQYYFNIFPFHVHSGSKPIFNISYNMSDYKFYIESDSYSKRELLNYIQKEISPYIHFNSNPTWQRFIIEIIKNDRSNRIFAIDTELNGGVYYSQSDYRIGRNIHHLKDMDKFKKDLCNCISNCLDLFVELHSYINTIEIPINPIKKCEITGADTDIYISTITNNLNTLFVIENDQYEPLMFIKNKELLKQYLKYQMRYARYLEKKDILSNTTYYKDYYPGYGHDSEQLLNDCYNYLI